MTKYLALLIFLTSYSAIGQPVAVIPVEERIDQLKIFLQDLEKNKSFSGSMLVLKNDKELLKESYGWADQAHKIKMTNATLISIGSITKSFTAVGILKLVELQKLSLKDNLLTFFKDVPPDKAHITVHQLLAHSSGIIEFTEGDGGDYEKIETEAFLKKVFRQPLAFEPGTKGVYSNVNYSLLGIIIEQVSGMSYEQYLKQFILQPVGIKQIGYQYPSDQNVTVAKGYQHGALWGTHQSHYQEAGGGPYWNLKANGGLEASIQEISIWIQALQHFKVLNKSLTELMFTGQMAEDATNGYYSFGYGCNISKTSRGTIMIDQGGSNGIYFARFIQLPEEGLVVAMITSESSMSTNQVLPLAMQLLIKGKMENPPQSQAFEHPQAEKIYHILVDQGSGQFEANLKSSGLIVEDDMILLSVGERLRDEGKVKEGIALYEFYVKAFPQIVVARNDLGDFYLKVSQREKAIQCYQEALRLRPGNQRAKMALANLGIH